MPPLGPLYGQTVFVDAALAMEPRIVFNAATHRDAIAMRWNDFVKMVNPIVGMSRGLDGSKESVIMSARKQRSRRSPGAGGARVRTRSRRLRREFPDTARAGRRLLGRTCRRPARRRPVGRRPGCADGRSMGRRHDGDRPLGHEGPGRHDAGPGALARVARLRGASLQGNWPEFAQQGKERITVRQLLAHQAGLFAIDEPVDRSVVADLDRLATVLARQKPAWEPGTAGVSRAQSRILRGEPAAPRGIPRTGRSGSSSTGRSRPASAKRCTSVFQRRFPTTVWPDSNRRALSPCSSVFRRASSST